MQTRAEIKKIGLNTEIMNKSNNGRKKLETLLICCRIQ